MKNIGQVLSGNNTVKLPENYSPTMIADLQYSSLTSVYVNGPLVYTKIFLQAAY